MSDNELKQTSANWALIEAAQDGKPNQEQALRWCRDRLQAYTELKDDVKCFVVLTNTGHWGRGKDLETAATNASAAGAARTAKAVVVLVLGDNLPSVTAYGTIVSNAGSLQISIGLVRTLGALLIKKK